jgi:hypothetical protein
MTPSHDPPGVKGDIPPKGMTKGFLPKEMLVFCEGG